VARRKGTRTTPWGSKRETDLWTDEDWQPSPMDLYSGKDRFFQAAYNYYGEYGPCFGGFDQKEASDDLAPLLRKMYEDGKREGTDMTVARQNPSGMKIPQGVRAVKIGRGRLVHCYSPKKGVLCGSGEFVSKHTQPLFETKAKHINCYRCEKLMTMNLQAGRSAGDSGR